VCLPVRQVQGTSSAAHPCPSGRPCSFPAGRPPCSAGHGSLPTTCLSIFSVDLGGGAVVRLWHTFALEREHPRPLSVVQGCMAAAW
jgi:hypothetical protein